MIDPRFQEMFTNGALESDVPITDIIRRIKELQEAEAEMRRQQREGEVAKRIPGSSPEEFINAGGETLPSYYEAARAVQSPPRGRGGWREFFQTIVGPGLAGLAAGATTPQGKGQGGHWNALGRGIAAGQARRDYDRSVEDATEIARQRTATSLYKTMMQGATGPLAQQRAKRAAQLHDAELASEMGRQDPNGPWNSFAPHLLFGGSVGTPTTEAEWARIRDAKRRTADMERRTTLMGEDDKRKQEEWTDKKREQDGEAIRKAMKDLIGVWSVKTHGQGVEALHDLDELIRLADQPAVLDAKRPDLMEWILYSDDALAMFDTFLQPATPSAREHILGKWRNYAERRGKMYPGPAPSEPPPREKKKVGSMEEVIDQWQVANPGKTREWVLQQPGFLRHFPNAAQGEEEKPAPSPTAKPGWGLTSPWPTVPPTAPVPQTTATPARDWKTTPRPTFTPTNTPGPTMTPTVTPLDQAMREIMAENPGISPAHAQQKAIARMREKQWQ